MHPKTPPPLPTLELQDAMNKGIADGLGLFWTHFWPYILLAALICIVSAILRGKIERLEEKRATERRVRDEIEARAKIAAEQGQQPTRLLRF